MKICQECGIEFAGYRTAKRCKPCQEHHRKITKCGEAAKRREARKKRCPDCHTPIHGNSRYCPVCRPNHVSSLITNARLANRHGTMSFMPTFQDYQHIQRLRRAKYALGDSLTLLDNEGKETKHNIGADTEISHIIPVSAGGLLTVSNSGNLPTELNRKAGDRYWTGPKKVIPKVSYKPHQILTHFNKIYTGEDWYRDTLTPQQDSRQKLALAMGKDKDHFSYWSNSQIRELLHLPNDTQHWLQQLTGYSIPPDAHEEYTRRWHTQSHVELNKWLRQNFEQMADRREQAPDGWELETPFSEHTRDFRDLGF